MLKLREDQLTIWDGILPEPIRQLPAELAEVDQLLDDPEMFAPFIEHFDSRMGRPTVPIETFLRLMYLKFRYDLGFESLVQEVQDSISWRRFCRLSLDAKVPDATTLIKARKRYGEQALEQVNEVLVQKLAKQKVLKHRKFRTDTTVIESDIHHPTDAGLLQDSVKVITRTIHKIKKVASHATQGFKDQTETMKEKMLSMVKVLRRRSRQSWEEVNDITADMVDLTVQALRDAKQVMTHLQENARDTTRQKTASLVATLNEALTRTNAFVEQAKEVISGNRVIPDRKVSFHDPEARPIKKGKLSKKTEFGYKVRIDETESGFVTGYEVYQGNPSDDELLIPAIEHHKRLFGQVPNAVATDRGFGSKANEKQLTEMGVKHVSAPLRGRKSKKRAEHESQLWFKSLQRYRAPGEAKISLLKRKYGLARSRFRGRRGSKDWVGFGILSHNLKRAADMAKMSNQKAS